MAGTPVLAIQIDEELQLRLQEERDASELFAVIDRNREHLRKWLGWVDVSTLESVRKHIQQTLFNFVEGKGIQTTIWYQGRLVGSIGLHNMNVMNRKIEIGYWLAEEAQGRGIMTRACQTLVVYAFERYNVNKVEIHCATGNRHSRRIPERLGFIHEATIRDNGFINDHFVDHEIYGMLASEWKAR